jgi:cyclohexanone monooxygenase
MAQESTGAGPSLDAVVVGAGFAGMYMLHRLRGLGLRVRVLEAGGGVGGTWYWNRYPGARCDVESIEYSYQFSEELQQDWEWSERYAAQPELLRYANHVADRFDLRRDIVFNACVRAAVFDRTQARWEVLTSSGRTTATYCIMATGCLSAPNLPSFEGADTFAGDRYHTGRWPHASVDFSGRRVAVIGTGSSAIQAIPVIAAQASRLYVFQRTPNYAVPAHNAPLDPDYLSSVKANYAALRARAKLSPTGIAFDYGDALALETSQEARLREYERRWRHGGLSFLGAYKDLMLEQRANDTAAEFVRSKIRQRVRDPAVAEALAPKNTIGCKRLCVDSGYYETFNAPHVALIDVADRGIERITPRGVCALGREYAVDAIVFATGFDAMTGALSSIDIRGPDSRGPDSKSLGLAWREGPRAYLGLAVAGFPNLFTITGPGSPSVLTNMLPSIEQHVEWIADLLAYMRTHRLRLVEARADAQEQWMAHVGEVAGRTLRYTCSSWYLGANVAGKPRVFMPYIGGFPRYVERCNQIAANGYEGFQFHA